MIKSEMIPEEVVEAAAAAIAQWHDGDDEFRKLYRMDARLAIAAAINAWPGARLDYWGEPDGAVLLPLPETPHKRGDSTENSDE